MQIKSTKDQELSKLLVLIYGQSGAGKTTLVSTLPNSLLVSVEGGELSLINHDVSYISISSKDGITKIEELKKILPEIAKSEFKNIYFDSLTEICGCFVECAKKEYPDDRQTMKVWGYVLEKMTMFIKYCRDLDKNIFFTCLEKIEKDEIGRRFAMPDLQGSIAHKLPQYFDLVMNLKVFQKDNEFVRKLICIGDETVIAKSRSQNLLKYEDANLSSILNKIKGV